MPGEWTAQLPDDLKTNEALTGYETIGDFAKDHLAVKGKLSEFEGKTKDFEGKVVDLEKRLGDSIPKLSEKATPEEIAAFNKALGVPDKPDGYVFDKIEGLPIDENLVGKYKDVAHKLGIPASKANELYKWFNGEAMEQAKAIEAQEKLTQEQQDAETLKAKSAAESSLKGEWGKDYEPNLEITRRMLQKFGNTELGEKLIASGLGNEPLMVKFLYQISKEFKDDTLASVMTPGGKEPLKEGMLQFTYPSMER